MTELSALEILEKLVSFPTVSDRSNLELIDWVEKYLNSFHIKTYRKYNEDKDKASLFAHVGPQKEGGVVLSGHTDVVPVEGQDGALIHGCLQKMIINFMVVDLAT